MNFATVTNIITMAFCFAVLVQSVRMMRSLKAVKDGALTDFVGALDKSTAQARTVLSELKAALGQCASNAHILEECKNMADELGVMIGIANASAERLLEVASSANRVPADAGHDESDRDAGAPRQEAA